MWKVDLHSHTIYSKDCLTRAADLITRARAVGLDKIAVTEHNRLDGALAAKKLAPDLVIVGEEIMTTHGEIIAYFVSEVVPRGLSPQETIRRLRDQGAVISIPHPAGFVAPLGHAAGKCAQRDRQCRRPGNSQRALCAPCR